MAGERPELIFVSGPHDGQRLTVARELAIIGRSPDVLVSVNEPYVSREHARLFQAPDGWIVESISDKGIRVNGKKYKPGKRILLDTGDVVSLGAETSILFVAPGESYEDALAAYRQAHPEPAPPPAAAPAPSAPPQAPAPEPSKAPAPEPVPTPSGARATVGADQAAQTPEEQSPDEVLRLQKQAKYKKYAIFLGVYMAALLALVLALAASHQKTVEESTAPSVLTDREIEEAITAPLTKGHNPVIAETALKQARLDPNPLNRGDVYNRIKEYKRYIAYNPVHLMEESKDLSRYESMVKELVANVKREYRNCWQYEKAGKWEDASYSLARIRELVPEDDTNDPTYKLLIENVIRHVRYVQKKLPQKQ